MSRLSLFLALTAFFLPAAFALASPDVDFPQNGQSYGGKVRSGPGMQYGQSGSLYQGDSILILSGAGVMMNGYEWFQVRYRNGVTGYHWGGSFTDVGGGRWQEADVYGSVNFQFREFGRDDWSVYLHDAARNVMLQLDLHRRMILYAQGDASRSNLYRITDAFPARGQQPVTGVPYPQPAAGDTLTVHYTCPEGLPLTVTYDRRGNGHVLYTIDGSALRRLEQVASGSGAVTRTGLILISIDQNPCAHFRFPMDMMVHG